MSDGKVAALFGGPTGERKVNPDVVALFEEYVEMARSGQICGAAVVYLCPDGQNGYDLRGRVGGHGMVGAATCLLSELVDVARGLEGDG
jgi:hypothetical protein